MSEQEVSSMPLEMMSMEQLQELKKQVQAQQEGLTALIENRKIEELNVFRNEILTKCKILGITQTELFEMPAVKPTRKRTQAVRAESRDPKYRHPTDPGKTWSGRGRCPQWAKELKVLYGDEWHIFARIPPSAGIPEACDG